MTITEKIYYAVSQIPSGKVTTYGAIAKAINTSPRIVGNALHKNPDPSRIPCHRVVNRRGELAQNFAFGGCDGQAKRLRSEGVTISNNSVNLAIFNYSSELQANLTASE